MNLEEEIAQVAHAYTCGCPDGDNPGATATAIAAEIMPLVKRAQAEAVREAADALDEDFQSIPAWGEAYREGVRTNEWMTGGTRMVMSAVDVLRARADRIESEVSGV